MLCICWYWSRCPWQQLLLLLGDCPLSVVLLLLLEPWLILLLPSAAVCGASYLLFGSAGPAFPEKYEHADGGTYRGEWQGLKKEGSGVYK